MARQPLVGQAVLTVGALRSHSDTIISRTLVDGWWIRRRDLYLTTQNNHKRPTFMPPTGFEPAIPTGEWSQTDTLDRVSTRIGN